MTNLNKLAKEIESGNRPSKDIDIIQFFKQLPNGEYVPDPAKRIQVRNKDRDVDFVEAFTIQPGFLMIVRVA